MADAVDYYDVQGMIRDARSEIRGEISRAVEDAKTTLRSEIAYLQNELESLREQVADALVNGGTLG